ncbi:hypothetical protein T12_6568 [Trichinella patagoniensis]|uniref:Uncharacterized protein n=1 Tax=Trichinella patagoniensis TaxID=990121 RepID=A0A0V0ZUQ0_9BILA|nr:hypothetical protein T12_6568 [Trichinella patagoniensis]
MHRQKDLLSIECPNELFCNPCHAIAVLDDEVSVFLQYESPSACLKNLAKIKTSFEDVVDDFVILKE